MITASQKHHYTKFSGDITGSLIFQSALVVVTACMISLILKMGRSHLPDMFRKDQTACSIFIAILASSIMTDSACHHLCTCLLLLDRGRPRHRQFGRKTAFYPSFGFLPFSISHVLLILPHVRQVLWLIWRMADGHSNP